MGTLRGWTQFWYYNLMQDEVSQLSRDQVTKIPEREAKNVELTRAVKKTRYLLAWYV